MDEIRRMLGRVLNSFQPDPEPALSDALRRGQRKRRTRQIVAGAMALAISGALFGALWMFFRPGGAARPAGPTPGPTASVQVLSPTFVPPLGKANCQSSPWADGEICTGRSGPVVTLALGEGDEGSWSLSAYRGVYDGPEPGVRPGRPPERVVRPVICISFAYVGPVSTFCGGSDGPGSSWGFDLGDLEGYDRRLAEDPGGDPFAIGRGGGFGGMSRLENWTLGTTSARTTSLVATLDDGRPVDVALYPSDRRLETSVKWWIAFLPIDAQRVLISARDANGQTLWEQDHDILQRLFIEKAGEGTGVVKGYWSYSLESPGPHAPHPEINCGTKCWYAHVSNPGSESFTLIAKPDDGSRFAGWGGSCEGEDETCEISMQETQTVTAIFEVAG